MRQIRLQQKSTLVALVEPVRETTVTYAIHFTDGTKMGCFSLDGAMRVIAYHCRVGRGELITDTTEEKISVWLYPGETPIAEVFRA